MEIWSILVAAGIPSSIVGIVCAYIIRKQVKDEKTQEEHQKNLESLVLMMLQSTHTK